MSAGDLVPHSPPGNQNKKASPSETLLMNTLSIEESTEGLKWPIKGSGLD